MLTKEDIEHLRALTIAHYVYAVVVALISVVGLVLIAVGAFVPFEPQSPADPPPAFFRALFIGLGLFFLVLYTGIAVLTWLAGRYMKQRRRHLYCLVIAGVDCMWFPIGTALGVFTFIVLLRPTVKAAFHASVTEPQPPAVSMGG